MFKDYSNDSESNMEANSNVDDEIVEEDQANDSVSSDLSEIFNKTPTSISAPKKRKLEDIAEKRIDEAYSILKDLTAKPPEKEECAMFCDLLCFKLKALHENNREAAMHEIDNIMYRIKQQQKSGQEIQTAPYWQHHNVHSGFHNSYSQQHPQSYPQSYPQAYPRPTPSSYSQQSFPHQTQLPPSPHLVTSASSHTAQSQQTVDIIAQSLSLLEDSESPSTA